MIENYKNLIELEKIDLRVIDLEKSKEEYPKTVEELEKAISEAKAVLENSESKLNEIKNEKKSVEELKTNAKLSLEKSQERLNSIKTNKEYDAVHAEIETHKSIINTAEKKQQKFSDEIEALENELKESKSEYDKIVEENQPQIDELKAKIATIDSAIAEVVSERDNLVPKISKQLVRIYDHIRTGRKRGKVLSIVDQKTRNCTICYQLLQPQVINQMRKENNIEYCQNCGSILILKESVSDEPSE